MPPYTLDKGLDTFAQAIIDDHYPLLKLVKIQYAFREEGPISDGKVTAGMCVRLDDRNWAIHKVDFLIEIAKDVWDAANKEFRLALMDHELAHAWVKTEPNDKGEEIPVIDENSGRIKTGCHKHDIEEFAAVLERHGAYHENLRTFLDAFALNKAAQKKGAGAAKIEGGKID